MIKVINSIGRHNNHNVYAPNNRASKCMKKKQTELKGEKDNFTIQIGGFNTSFSTTDRTLRQKKSADIEDQNNTINHLALIDIYFP